MKRNATTAIVIHTTASNSRSTFAQIMNYFLRILRWNKGGYHYIYERNGKENMAYNPLEMEATNGILPQRITPTITLSNLNCIHLSYIGGINDINANEAVNNITPEQEKAMINRIKELLKVYPKAGIIGHNQINLKYCPSFWTADWLRAWDIPEDNIWDVDTFNIAKTVKALPSPADFYKKRNQKTDSKICSKCGLELK